MKVVCVFPFDKERKQRLIEAAKGAEIIFTNNNIVTEQELANAQVIIGNVDKTRLDKCTSLKWLQLDFAGTEGYTGLIDRGVLLTNSTGAYGLAISEHMLGMLLEIKKKLYLYRDNQHREMWQSMGTVTSIEGTTTLVLGMGDIGSAFARKMKALGSYIIGVRRNPASKPDYCDELYTMDKLNDLIPRADIIAMSLPGNAETRHTLNKERLALTKKGSVILNVGRGTAIDTEALCDLLEAGHFEGVGLDVTDPEPLPEGHRLWHIKNAIVTPHVSGAYHLQQTIDTIQDIAIENMKKYVSGERLNNLVDPATGYRRSN